jgi:hypothetical protein
VPVTAELFGHFCDAARTAPYLLGDPAPGPVRHGHTWGVSGRRWPGSPRSMSPWQIRDRRSTNAPCATRWTLSDRRKVGRPVRPPNGPSRGRCWTADRDAATGLDVDEQRLAGATEDAKHAHFRQSDKQLTHARRVRFRRGSPGSFGLRNLTILRAPASRLVDALHLRSGC